MEELGKKILKEFGNNLRAERNFGFVRLLVTSFLETMSTGFTFCIARKLANRIRSLKLFELSDLLKSI